jgi:hypothetical protein
VDGLLNVNALVAGTPLPKVSSETIERILRSNPFAHWWKGDNPLSGPDGR